MTQAPPSDITAVPLCVTLDIAADCFDPVAFAEALRVANRREIIVLNAEELVEVAKLSSKLTSSEISMTVVRAIRARVDQELAKVIDAKKKLQAAIEKQRQLIEVAKSKKGARTIPEPIEPEEPRFDGKLDLLFMITDFCFTPGQLDLMEEIGLPIFAYLSLVPGPLEENRYVQPEVREENVKSSRRRREAKKKVEIPGKILGHRQNPGIYPPARWDALRPVVSTNMPFRELVITASDESAFFTFEREIVKLIRAKDAFKMVEGKPFVDIPICQSDNDTSGFMTYVKEHEYDFVNGIWHQLVLGEYETMRPKEAQPESAEYGEIFDGFALMSARGVVAEPEKKSLEPYFHIQVPPSVMNVLRDSLNFTPNEENAAFVEASAKFLASPKNFSAFAGQKFEQLTQQINKKYQLNLPTSFYDWSQWSLASESANGAEVITDAIADAAVHDVMFDSALGLTWILTMKPVPRSTGHSVSQVTVPQTMRDISEWIENLFDGMIDKGDKRARAGTNPATVINEKADFSALLKPLSERFDAAKKLYRMPVSLSNACEFKVPYFFDCGARVEVDRHLYRDQMSFAYTVAWKDKIHVVCSHETMRVHAPHSDFRIQFCPDPWSLTAYFNDCVMYFDGKQLVMKKQDHNPVIVSTDGHVVINRGEYRMIVLGEGPIVHFKGGIVENVDVAGVLTVDGEVVDKPHAKTVDMSTGDATVIRPDDIRYIVTRDGTRKIHIDESFDIEQTSTTISIDMPAFPVLTVAEESITCTIDGIDLTFKDGAGKIETPDLAIVMSDSEAALSSNSCEMNMSLTCCQVRCGDQVLVSDQDGTEAMGTSFEPSNSKKKVTTIETAFGAIVANKEQNAEPVIIQRHKIFPPRFFAVRSDLSVVEFMRKDILGEMVEKRLTITHPCGENVTILSRHLPEAVPFVYLENEVMSKPARAALLKGLVPPKAKASSRPAKGQEAAPAAIPATESVSQYLSSVSEFSDMMNRTLMEQQKQYIIDITPVPPPPPDIVRLPPPNPSAALQKMQHGIREGRVTPGVTNYWNSPESDFGYPLSEPRVPERPVSPRTGLFDAPRFSARSKDDPAREYTGGMDRTFVTDSNIPGRPVEEEPSVVWKGFLGASSPEINFGTVKVGTTKTTHITLTNTFTRPVHFALSQIDSSWIRVTSIPGVIYPGLKTTITVEMSDAKFETVNKYFEFRTRAFTMTIPVKANVVE